jgi:hypothetical protein
MNKQEIIDYLEFILRNSIGFLYKWLTTDGEVLGYIVIIIHILCSITIFLCIIYSHTIYPLWQFKLGVFICLLLVWLQHIFLDVCIFTVSELKLTNGTFSSNIHLSYFFSKLLGTKIEDAMNLLVLCEFITISCFSLELISELSLYLYNKNGMFLS